MSAERDIADAQLVEAMARAAKTALGHDGGGLKTEWIIAMRAALDVVRQAEDAP